MYTGNTFNANDNADMEAVYPCVYREHVAEVVNKLFSQRFIPVYTGNTISLRIETDLISVYPCVYREHF